MAATRSDEEITADVVRLAELERAIGDTPSATLDGAIVQVRAVRRVIAQHAPEERELTALDHALATLEQVERAMRRAAERLRSNKRMFGVIDGELVTLERLCAPSRS